MNGLVDVCSDLKIKLVSRHAFHRTPVDPELPNPLELPTAPKQMDSTVPLPLSSPGSSYEAKEVLTLNSEKIRSDVNRCHTLCLLNCAQVDTICLHQRSIEQMQYLIVKFHKPTTNELLELCCNFTISKDQLTCKKRNSCLNKTSAEMESSPGHMGHLFLHHMAKLCVAWRPAPAYSSDRAKYHRRC